MNPVKRLMTIILSNGATLRMPTAAQRTKPFRATQDLFEHSAWSVRVKGLETVAKEGDKERDLFSSFYGRFGYDDGEGADDDDGFGGPFSAAQQQAAAGKQAAGAAQQAGAKQQQPAGGKARQGGQAEEGGS